MDNYHVYDVIGRGKYSTVHKGKKKGSVIKNFALKSVDKSHGSTVAQEARILQNLDHSNVVKFYEGHETSTHLWLILEYCGGGDLRTLLEQEGKLAEDEVRDLARDLVEGLRYIHSKGIIHCDLKPSNILLDGNGTTKLCDFGLSREVSETCFSLVPQAANKKRRGTPSYMAPELFDDGGVDSYASDLWALGCVLYECYAGRPPFIGNELTQLVKSILYDPTPSLPGNPSPSFANLVSRLLIKDPTDRIEWSEICTHTFWITPQPLISQFVLPPQPAFDNMMQQQQLSYYKPEGNLENKTPVILRRLSRIAKSNLQRENEKTVENDTTDVKIENRDMELDFNEYTEDAFTPTVDEHLLSTQDQEEERLIRQHEIDSSSEESEHESYDDDSGGGAVDLAEVLWHESDLLVLPVMPKSDKQSDVLLQSTTLSFHAIPSSDFVKLPQDQLDDVTESIVTILTNKKTPIGEKQNVLRYLEMLSTNEAAANILTNGSIMPILVKLLRCPSNLMPALRGQLASLVGLLIRHSTFISDHLSNSGILDALSELLGDSTHQKKVRRFSMAALGDLLSYISTADQDDQSKASNPTKTSSSGWQVPDTLISLVASLATKVEDDIIQLYALRTIENVSGQGGHWSTCFNTEDVINNLCTIFRDPGKQETIRFTAGSCLVRLVSFTPPTIKHVMEKLKFKETATIALSRKTRPKEQQICLNLLNIAVHGCKYSPDIVPHLDPLVEVKKLVPNLVSLVANGGEVLCGKALLFVTLLCRNDTWWLGKFFLKGKLLSAMDNLMVEVKEEQVYLQQCLVAFMEGVVAVIPKWLEDVIDALRKGRGVAALTGSSSKTNPPPLQVLLNLLGSSWFWFKHKVVNAEVLKQLAVLIKLVEPPFQGTDDFQASVVAVLAIFTSYSSFIQQHRKIFVRKILPSASIICQKSENGKTRFFCLKIWFEVVVALLNESSLPHKKKELKQMCNDHFHPLHTRLMTDEDSTPIFANKLWELLVESDII